MDITSANLFIIGVISSILIYLSDVAPDGSFIDRAINKANSLSGIYIAMG